MSWWRRKSKGLNVQEMTRELAESASQATKTLSTLDEFFELVPDIMLLVNVTGTIMRANREWTRITGWSTEETVGRHFREFIVPKELGSL